MSKTLAKLNTKMNRRKIVLEGGSSSGHGGPDSFGKTIALLFRFGPIDDKVVEIDFGGWCLPPVQKDPSSES
jgi:hypothetical protein